MKKGMTKRFAAIIMATMLTMGVSTTAFAKDYAGTNDRGTTIDVAQEMSQEEQDEFAALLQKLKRYLEKFGLGIIGSNLIKNSQQTEMNGVRPELPEMNGEMPEINGERPELPGMNGAGPEMNGMTPNMENVPEVPDGEERQVPDDLPEINGERPELPEMNGTRPEMNGERPGMPEMNGERPDMSGINGECSELPLMNNDVANSGRMGNQQQNGWNQGQLQMNAGMQW